jgi:hypothetical protein
MRIGVSRQCLGELHCGTPAKNAMPMASPSGSVNARLHRRPADHLALPGRQAANTPRNAQVLGELATRPAAMHKVEPYHAQIGYWLCWLLLGKMPPALGLGRNFLGTWWGAKGLAAKQEQWTNDMMTLCGAWEERGSRSAAGLALRYRQAEGTERKKQ